MPSCCLVEETTKCRFLFYNKSTGAVMDVGSGGGAGATLTGDAFIMWRYNSVTAPLSVACIPYYFNKLGQTGKPLMIDLTKAADYEAKSRSWQAAKMAGDAVAIYAAFEEM